MFEKIDKLIQEAQEILESDRDPGLTPQERKRIEDASKAHEEQQEKEYDQYYKDHPEEADPMAPGFTPNPHLSPDEIQGHVPASLLHRVGEQASDSGLV